MSVSPVSTAAFSPLDGYHQGYVMEPCAGFFEDFCARFDAWQVGGEEAGVTVDKVLGATHTELQNRRGVAEADRERYAEILDQAYSQNGMNDPVAFIKGLSKSDLDVIRRTHSLADAIDPAGLTREGACNLLLPDGFRVDLNRDGLSEVGAAKMCVFPPLDAPEPIKAAWLAATKDMSEGDYFTYELVLWGTLHPIDGSTMKTVRGLPTDDAASYSKALRQLLEANDLFRSYLAPGQYERDKAFFQKLLSFVEV